MCASFFVRRDLASAPIGTMAPIAEAMGYQRQRRLKPYAWYTSTMYFLSDAKPNFAAYSFSYGLIIPRADVCGWGGPPARTTMKKHTALAAAVLVAHSFCYGSEGMR